jgi:hypothetical protein
MHREFQAFDPFNSFSSEKFVFLDRAGEAAWQSTLNQGDVLALWHLGRDAFQALGKFEDQADFDASFCEHLASIAMFAKVLKEESTDVFQDEPNTLWKPNFHEWQSIEILGIYSQISNSIGTSREHLARHFLFACLEEIDFALKGLALHQDHLQAVISATLAFANFQVISAGHNVLQQARSELALRAARERHSRDPKQVERNFVFECWKEWKRKPASYKGKAAFARAMLDKCEYLTSQKNIEDWCRLWEGKHKS